MEALRGMGGPLLDARGSQRFVNEVERRHVVTATMHAAGVPAHCALCFVTVPDAAAFVADTGILSRTSAEEPNCNTDDHARKEVFFTASEVADPRMTRRTAVVGTLGHFHFCPAVRGPLKLIVRSSQLLKGLLFVDFGDVLRKTSQWSNSEANVVSANPTVVGPG
ncbi:hypothetical protein C8R44DRAFT_726525 [Mycena epipterygia]|nr:hypothetical protein C8R44DRAFT_726525 [Mycena epipterygia]